MAVDYRIFAAGIVPVIAPLAAAQAGEADDAAAFNLHGLALLDAALLDGAAAKKRDAQESELRLAEFGFTYTARDWTGLAFYDFSRGGSWRDVGVFRAKDGLLLALGQFKEPVSMDKLTLPDGTLMMENALFAKAFGLQRRTGVIAGRYTNNWSILGGAFQGSLDRDDAHGRGAGQSAVSLRATLSGHEDEAAGRWHAGAWLRRVDYYGRGVVAGSSPNSLLASKTIYVDLTDPSALAETSVSAGAELAWSRPGLHLAGEWARQAFEGPGADGDIAGGYVAASWIVTGEQRHYIKKKGAFMGIVPDRPVTAGGLGALEITARVDHLDFDDFARGRSTAFSAGVSWTPVEHVRLRTEFTAQRGSGVAEGRDSDVLMIRLQAGF